VRRAEPMPFDTGWPRVMTLVEDVMARLFYRPDIEPDAELEERMERLNQKSEELFDPEA
jgi:hypothetical protein